MKTHTFYSAEEDRVICETIKKNIGNIEEAFKRAHILLPNRSIPSLQMRWYRVLRKGKEQFSLVTDKIQLKNTKICNNSRTVITPLTEEEKTFINFARVNKRFVNLTDIKNKIIEKAISDCRDRINKTGEIKF